MAQYKIGTISITSGTNVVTGVGTLFLANVSVGDSFKVTGVNALYGVIAVDSNTQIRISPNYAGANVSGGQYQITSDFTVNLNLAEISAGDSEVAFHLTHEVIRKLDTAVAGKCAAVGPGSAQAFSVGALTAAGGVLSSSGTQGVHLSSSENSINYGYGQNADALTYINLYGYQNSTTRFRSLEVRDGKAGLIAHFDGPTGRVFVGSGVDNGSGAKLQVSGKTSANAAQLRASLSVYGEGSPLLSAFYGTDEHFRVYMGAAWDTVLEAVPVATKTPELAFKVAGAERSRFNYAGNLLINTATDNGSGAKLQVNGSASMDRLLVRHATASAMLTLDGVGSAASGALISINKGGTQTAIIAHESAITGAGTSSNLSNFVEVGLGFNWMVNGSIAKAMTLAASGNLLLGTPTDNGSGAKLQVNGGAFVNGSLTFQAPSSITPANIADTVFEATNNTTFKIKFKGSDGVVRSATLTLS